MQEFKVGDRVVLVHFLNYGIPKEMFGRHGTVDSVGVASVHIAFDSGERFYARNEMLDCESDSNPVKSDSNLVTIINSGVIGWRV